MQISDQTRAQLLQKKEELAARYQDFKSKGLKLDLSRGKPGPDQFSLCDGIFHVINDGKDCISPSGVDCRNYGVPDGLVEMKRIFAEILDVEPEEVIVGGNSSLNLMFDVISQAMISGFGCGGWLSQGKVKFLCPSPGYDRHFAVTEYFGVELIPVDMTDSGPDMDQVERLTAQDASIKGMWCVPKYSNPDGITYSDETVRRIARLRPAASDFRVMWDNSYAVHDLSDEPDVLLPILPECKKQHNEDLVLLFTSTSKISFAGGGVAAMAASENNRKRLLERIGIQTIGPDKINQLRHILYFRDMEGIRQHMRRQAEIIKPKFEVVLRDLEQELTGVVEWRKPNGGYFVSVNTPDGCAKRVVALCKEAGVVLTPAGATYPYGKDPRDRNIRLAPTFAPMSELTQAMELFCVAAQLAVLEKIEERS